MPTGHQPFPRKLDNGDVVKAMKDVYTRAEILRRWFLRDKQQLLSDDPSLRNPLEDFEKIINNAYFVSVPVLREGQVNLQALDLVVEALLGRTRGDHQEGWAQILPTRGGDSRDGAQRDER